MNLNQLEYFIAAAETLNFTKAAQRCFISQTAMSQQIHALEERIGVPLFIRDKHHVELTTAGKVYLKEARTILTKNEDAIILARSAADGIKGNISIGYIRGYGQSDFTNELKRFHSSFPDITISLYRDNQSALFEKLEEGECDVIFSTSAEWSKYPEIMHRYLKSYPINAVVSPENHLAEQEYVTYEDLKDENFIIMQPSGRPQGEMEESLLIYKRGGFFPTITALERDPEALLLMISVGMGISILPEYLTRAHKYSDDLKILPILKQDGSAETFDFEISWRKNNTNPAVDHLLSSIK